MALPSSTTEPLLFSSKHDDSDILASPISPCKCSGARARSGELAGG
eukprot:CAMPEP_0176332768 /NCGR_PEP_ID=MMETSP0121_2-20121125/77239_1 /TAXON_ID=160619 /ORGANISM="Kryptoperidinium foliaceum, Strain CCMP 1326" /LENGTH=45 /DNA_ID= /DNA_START= /DNA_END= /DNA_ORIENTATION=